MLKFGRKNFKALLRSVEDVVWPSRTPFLFFLSTVISVIYVSGNTGSHVPLRARGDVRGSVGKTMN